MRNSPDTEKSLQKECLPIGVWGRFLFNVSLLVVLALFVIVIGSLMRNEELIEHRIEARARSYFELIVLMRRWNAQYDGVFVEKTAGVISNPYLENPDITTTNGTIYTKKNPALMTREVSELAKEAGGFTFHITSLRPLNPNNMPDAFEADALNSFKSGVPETWADEEEGERTFFRYMAPMFAETQCLTCHAKQGYVEGQAQGGISVRFDITDETQGMAWTDFYVMLLTLILVGVLIVIMYIFVRGLMRKLKIAIHRIEELAVTDELTGAFNRRYLFE